MFASFRERTDAKGALALFCPAEFATLAASGPALPPNTNSRVWSIGRNSRFFTANAKRKKKWKMH
jgi:hypothetical protein